MCYGKKRFRFLSVSVLVFSLTLVGCSKDEILEQYNNVVQSAGNAALTSDFSLKGNRTYGEDWDFDNDRYWKIKIFFAGNRANPISGYDKRTDRYRLKYCLVCPIGLFFFLCCIKNIAVLITLY